MSQLSLTAKLSYSILNKKNMSTMHRVFVYGTLKRNEPNHNWLKKSQDGITRFIGEAKTCKKYPLIIATKYNIPFLLHAPDQGHHVQGELYEVNDVAFKHLDELEDHPNFYMREIDDVLVQNTQTPTKAWIYFIKTFRPEMLKRETYESYSSKGPHGLVYLERYLREKGYDHKTEILLKTK